jgi:perosamine synthetase
MSKKDTSKNKISQESKIKDVLDRLDSGIGGIIFIVDEQEKVLGIFTDSDIRKVFARGANLEDRAIDYMNKDFVYGKESNSKEDNIKLITANKQILPILDGENKLIDFMSLSEICRVPLMAPSLEGNELKYVTDCIKTNWISSQGTYVKKFEEMFRDFCKIDFATSCSNGTAALHLALKAIDIKEGDEVIVPNFTFASPLNVIIHCNAKPVIVDIDKNNWTLDPTKIEEKITQKTKAIIAVHIYGHPCNMNKIMDIAKRHNLKVIEDCAESLGATYNNKLTGTIGDIGCFSFFANKVITTGEGGMVITKDPEVYKKLELLRDHGMTKKRRYWHEIPGFNYRLTNLQAAVGVAQMERIDHFIKRRREIAKRYNENLKDVEGINIPPEEEWAKNIYWLYTILIDKTICGINRDQLSIKLHEAGVETRPTFYPLNKQPPYFNEEEYPITELVAQNGLSLPGCIDIKMEKIDEVCNIIKNIIQHDKMIKGVLDKK